MDEHKKKEFMKIINPYYDNDFTRKFLVNYTRYREFSMMTPKGETENDKIVIRCLNYYNDINFKYYYRNTGFQEGKYLFNLYTSLARYMKPRLSWIGDINRKQKMEDFIKEHESYMIGYDFAIDIDCDSQLELPYVFESAKKVFIYFIKTRTPFRAKFSGLGVHFEIPYEFFKREGINKSFISTDDDTIYKMFYGLASYLASEISEMVDATIYDSRRMLKLYGSIAIYQDDLFLCNDLNVSLLNMVLKSKNPIDFFRITQKKDLKVQPHTLHNKGGNVLRFCKDAGVKLK